MEAVGRDAILRRLGGLENRLVALAAELDANQREYDELHQAHRIALTEHERLVAKLRALDAEVIA